MFWGFERKTKQNKTQEQCSHVFTFEADANGTQSLGIQRGEKRRYAEMHIALLGQKILKIAVVKLCGLLRGGQDTSPGGGEAER